MLPASEIVEVGPLQYAAGTTPGHPEVFTPWMFVFNHPEFCTVECGPDDMTNPAVEFGVYNPAGHVAAGGSLTLAGRVGVGGPRRRATRHHSP